VRITGTINGQERALDVEPSTLLLDLLRDLGYTGAKPSCEMEVCGSCTVQLDGLPVSACTTLAAELDGRSVETIEGLGRFEDDLHPVQQAFLKHSAFQCGFCTPGMIMSAKALLETTPAPSRDDVVHWLEGSICRCTGYEPIIDAVCEAAEAMARA
jgi:aerobic-type carbon monoxide dehydrogenase small subunit (CoxS/CutS family)